jgi:uncharacterized membrane protein
MKKSIGLIALLLSLAFINIIILRIWNIQIMSIDSIVRSSATLLVLGITIVLLMILYGAFFRNNEQNYNRKTGNRAHPKL